MKSMSCKQIKQPRSGISVPSAKTTDLQPRMET